MLRFFFTHVEHTIFISDYYFHAFTLLLFQTHVYLSLFISVLTCFYHDFYSCLPCFYHAFHQYISSQDIGVFPQLVLYRILLGYLSEHWLNIRDKLITRILQYFFETPNKNLDLTLDYILVIFEGITGQPCSECLTNGLRSV